MSIDAAYQDAFTNTVGLSELEVLLNAERTLSGKEPFNFDKWEQCTCGHIYAGAGGVPSSAQVMDSLDAGYAAAMNAIIVTYGQEPCDTPWRRASQVSDLTCNNAKAWHGITRINDPRGELAPRVNAILRRTALRMVKETIARLTAQHQSDMLGVAIEGASR